MGRLGGSPSVRKAAVPGGQLGDLPLSDPVSRCPKVSDAHESNNVTRIPHQFLEDPERWIRYHSAETGADRFRPGRPLLLRVQRFNRDTTGTRNAR